MQVLKPEERLVEVVELKGASFKEPTVILGFPGPGFVGTIVAQHIIEALELGEVAHVYSPLIPCVCIFHKGALRHPLRIHGNEELDLMVMVSEIPIPPASHYYIAKAIFNWITSKNAKFLICCEGISVPRRHEPPLVYGVAEPGELDVLDKFGVKPLDRGYVAGITALFLNFCLTHKIKGVCLLAEAYDKIPDPEAAAELVKVLNKAYNLNVGVEPLMKEAATIKDVFRELTHKAHAVKEAEKAMYI